MKKLLHILFVYNINDYIMKPTPRFRGPSLLLLAIVHLLIFASGLVAAAVLRHGARFATPFAPAEELRTFLALSPTAVRVSNFFLFGSAIPFGIFAVTTVSRLRFLGVRAAGTNIALLGGLIATIALVLSGCVGWILSAPEVLTSAPIVKAINFLNFLLGGAVFAVGFGLLAGVSVTCYSPMASPALAGRLWNAHGTHGRALLPQSRCISGKLLYPHYQVLRLHLDAFSRRSTHRRSQRSAGRLDR